MNIFVGNISFDAKEADVYKLFMPFGSVTNVCIVMDKKGKHSRGFGFLEMPDELQAKAAIAALNGKDLMGRPLLVEPSLSKKPGERIRPGPGYKAGRRSRSFMKKRLAAGITEPVPERKEKDNPLRWRKNKPWVKKKRGETPPWQKVAGEPAPWAGKRPGKKTGGSKK